MKLLIDENLPKRLKFDLSEFDVYTVFDKGWNSKKNGELLKLMLDESFDVLITFDKNLQYQQNFEKYPISVMVLNTTDNTYHSIKQLVPQILGLLKTKLPVGPTIIGG